jgi:hypothetical protein
MTMFKKLLITAAAAGGLAMMASAPASAYVACNSFGDCWHTDSRIRVPGVTFTWHPDEWYFHQRWDDRHHFRGYHEGRGYWRNGIWITL